MLNQAKSKTDTATFLRLAEKIPVIDVRSPSEFSKGHIPGSHNIPLFDDSEREKVGIKYKKVGRTAAILEGLRLSGPLVYSKLEQALKISSDGRLLLYCWRGGMRSEAMDWLFSLGDIDTEILDGGYKSYRHFVLDNLSVNRKMVVLGGLTGSGKTHILKYIRESGHQVIDLEGLANHKGSAFGSIGQPPQPSSEQFANMLFDEWKQIDPGEPVWIEDESRNIGNVFMPEQFYLNLQKNPAIIIRMDSKTRLPRLLEEYSSFSTDELMASVMKISKRLGGDRTREAIDAIRSGDFQKAIEITLQYYDKAYLFGLKRREEKNTLYLDTDTDNIEINAGRIIEKVKDLTY